MATATISTLAPAFQTQTPADDGTLYLIADDGADMGIGTATEVRGLIAAGILPHTVILTPVRGGAA